MNVLELLQPITTFVFDVDGVLTNGTLFLLPGGEMVRQMHVKDGYALQLAVKKGYRVVLFPVAILRWLKIGCIGLAYMMYL